MLQRLGYVEDKDQSSHEKQHIVRLIAGLLPVAFAAVSQASTPTLDPPYVALRDVPTDIVVNGESPRAVDNPQFSAARNTATANDDGVAVFDGIQSSGTGAVEVSANPSK